MTLTPLEIRVTELENKAKKLISTHEAQIFNMSHELKIMNRAISAMQEQVAMISETLNAEVMNEER